MAILAVVRLASSRTGTVNVRTMLLGILNPLALSVCGPWPPLGGTIMNPRLEERDLLRGRPI